MTALKNDTKKVDYSLMPVAGIEAACQAFMVGEEKYGRYNYYKGMESSRLVAALLRHAHAFNEGEESCPIDGQSHLGSVIACASMILQQQKLGTFRDNRYMGEATPAIPDPVTGFEVGDAVAFLLNDKRRYGVVSEIKDSSYSYPIVVSIGECSSILFTEGGSYFLGDPVVLFKTTKEII